jgi:signal transduction histidine kinase
MGQGDQNRQHQAGIDATSPQLKALQILSPKMGNDTEPTDTDKSLLREVRHYLEAVATDMTHYEVIRGLMHDLSNRVAYHRNALEQLRNKQRILIERDPIYRHLKAITDEAQSTLDNLQDVVDKIRRPPYQPGNYHLFDIREVVKRAAESMRSALEHANMTTHFELDHVECYGDPALLNNVVLNLILNSIQAQKTRSRMRRNAIHLRLKRSATTWTLTFWDEGPGINQAVWQPPSRIFEAGSTERRDTVGTGYGLFVSRKIIELSLRGTMELVDARSALFRITCPILESG